MGKASQWVSFMNFKGPKDQKTKVQTCSKRTIQIQGRPCWVSPIIIFRHILIVALSDYFADFECFAYGVHCELGKQQR